MADFVANDGRRLGNDSLKQKTELGDVPLAVSKLEQMPTDGLVAFGGKVFKESRVGVHYAQALHDQRFRQSIDDTLRLDMPASKQAIKVFKRHVICPRRVAETRRRDFSCIAPRILRMT